MRKLGTDFRGTLFIQLSSFPDHYLVLVVMDLRFQYALITTKPQPEAPFGGLVLEDIAWLDFDRIHETSITSMDSKTNPPSKKRKRGGDDQIVEDNLTDNPHGG